MRGKCKWCGKTYQKSYNSQAYCCEEHRRLARQQQNRDNFFNWYHKNKHLLPERCCLGSGGLGMHRHDDPEVEYEKIRREFKRLRLKS